MTVAARYRIDDLRRFASALIVGVGVASARAGALAAQLLWFDAAGATSLGIAHLPDWLDRIDSGAVDPQAEGKVLGETTGTAVLDAQNGIPPLLLARGGELAIEKARACGVGLVRLVHVGPSGPSAPVVADLAIGPYVGWAVGPGPSWSLALPSEEGLPAVFDSALANGPIPAFLAPWAAALGPEGTCLVGAIAVAALEPLATLQERVSASMKDVKRDGGLLAPALWEARRREAREHGVAVKAAVWTRLTVWSQRFQIEPPTPR